MVGYLSKLDVLVILSITSLCALRAAEYGRTPLMNAVDKGDLEQVRLILESGANVNQGDIIGETPLIWAINLGNKDIATLLLESGGDHNHARAYFIENKKNDKVALLDQLVDQLKRATQQAILDARQDMPEELADLIATSIHGQ